ncbi:MAG: aminopeptidase [Euryarchaeota archaeon]|jgi:aminopeptidase|nr:aminopeptidase [Euryarchaeota archaeon]MBT4408079.1 aminopeptidase [Euryarchaeota archaeon]
MVRKKSPDTVAKSSDDEDIEKLNDDEIVDKSDGESQGDENHVGVEDSGYNEKGDDISEEEPKPEMTAEERESAMKESAKMVVDTCMDIYRHENVLIIADPSTSDIGEALYSAASSVSERVLMVIMPKGKHHGDDPPPPVASLMRQQDVILAPTKYSITHTKARLDATRSKARIATMPGMTIEMFTEGGMRADFADIKAQITEVFGILRRKRRVQVTTPAGTNVSFDVFWREWNLDDSGICNRPGMVTNLPAGKIFCPPKEGNMEGVIVIDGAWDADLVNEEITLEIENGVVVDVTGGSEAAQIRHAFREAAARLKPKNREAIWNVAEFGIGMNRAARLLGNILEDEKVLGTCYFTIGALGVGQSTNIVGVLKNPTIRIDGHDIVIDGNLTV